MTLIIKKERPFYGELLYHKRRTKGLNQAEVAKMVGCTKNAVSQWETGKTRPNSRFLFRLSTALNVDPSYFYRQVRDKVE